MSVLDYLSKLFGRRKTLADVDADDLRREEIRISREEKRVEEELDELYEQEKELLERGRGEAAQHRKARVAMQIKSLRNRSRIIDRNLSLLRKQHATITGLKMIKEQEGFLKRAGVSSIISNMDMADVQVFIEKATVDGQLQMEKFTNMVSMMDDATETMVGGDEADSELASIMEELDSGQAAGAGREQAVERSIEEGLKKADEALKREKEAE